MGRKVVPVNEFLQDPEEFLWSTQEGEILSLAEMETKHCFNAAKALFNAVAEAWGGRPVWYVKKYPDYQRSARQDPQEFLKPFRIFYAEIERRGDLPEKYYAPWREIKEQIFGSTPKMRRLGPAERGRIE
jgi:hypothetical protein